MLGAGSARISAAQDEVGPAMTLKAHRGGVRGWGAEPESDLGRSAVMRDAESGSSRPQWHPRRAQRFVGDLENCI